MRCLDVKTLRSKVGYGKTFSLLWRESKRSSETSYACERGLSHELINIEPSPVFQAPSAQGRQGHTHRTALRFPLSPQVARGKIRRIEDMKGNSFTDKVYSLFTTHHSLIQNNKDFSRFSIKRKSNFLLHS